MTDSIEYHKKTLFYDETELSYGEGVTGVGSAPQMKSFYAERRYDMKLKTFLAGLVLCLVSVLLISAETASAKTSKKIVLTPETTMETHKTLFIDVEISLKDVATLEYVNKKLTKTAGSLWKAS